MITTATAKTEENINITEVIMFMKMMIVSVTMATVVMAEMMRAYGRNSAAATARYYSSRNVMRAPGCDARCLTSP